ncbi:S41 family peptidase [Pseudoalteromonas sp. 1_2015MBL_MicDiv]|uniref:S41 family peptidase n=1 Tax=Pseudoalteromonas sp. 1_2015MBL_MicDiv TaxID=1720343 RepID=UPI000BBEFF2F|nr:S41 family peptidase [Pseudoalteromonas sp. 1_2015MBL_MicDiv]ATG78848.1 peptidase [Pseudoalteromonas sp. 1_2015MBL_MicDiv]
MFIPTKLNIAKTILPLTLISILSACGGGGGGILNDSNSVTPIGSNTTTWTANEFARASQFKGQCQASDEKNWLRSWSNETYLWYDEIIDTDPALTSGVLDYFEQLKTNELTESGAKKDNFHFNLPTNEWERQNQAGVSYGYGFNIKILASSAPRQAIISYTQPNTPASNQNLTRGFELVEVDGIDFVNTNSSNDVSVINAGLFPTQTGKVTEFVFKDINTNENRTVTLTSQNITSQPVSNVRTDLANGEVGYFQFNSHNAIAEEQLYNAFNQLAASDIKDLVIDIRYNGGGLLQMASQIAYMIAGNSNTQGKVFERTIFNDKNPNTNPITGQALTPMSFTNQFVGFESNPSITPGTPLPTLNLNRVFVLTTSSTCSASEAIINGLRGADVEVIQVGSGTCGKPYGFYPTDNCDTTYFTIQFTGENNKGFGEFSDGFAPQNTLDNALQPLLIAGCAVADDFTTSLGDANEALLKTALSYRTTESCPAPSSTSSKQGFAPSIVDDSPKVEDTRVQTMLNQNIILSDNIR